MINLVKTDETKIKLINNTPLLLLQLILILIILSNRTSPYFHEKIHNFM